MSAHAVGSGVRRADLCIGGVLAALFVAVVLDALRPGEDREVGQRLVGVVGRRCGGRRLAPDARLRAAVRCLRRGSLSLFASALLLSATLGFLYRGSGFALFLCAPALVLLGALLRSRRFRFLLLVVLALLVRCSALGFLGLRGCGALLRRAAAGLLFGSLLLLERVGVPALLAFALLSGGALPGCLLLGGGFALFLCAASHLLLGPALRFEGVGVLALLAFALLLGGTSRGCRFLGSSLALLFDAAPRLLFGGVTLGVRRLGGFFATVRVDGTRSLPLLLGMNRLVVVRLRVDPRRRRHGDRAAHRLVAYALPFAEPLPILERSEQLALFARTLVAGTPLSEHQRSQGASQ